LESSPRNSQTSVVLWFAISLLGSVVEAEALATSVLGGVVEVEA